MQKVIIANKLCDEEFFVKTEPLPVLTEPTFVEFLQWLSTRSPEVVALSGIIPHLQAWFDKD